MASSLKILVCGGRNYADRDELFATLDWVNNRHGIHSLCHGGCGYFDEVKQFYVYTGADRFAGEWCKARGINCIVFPAEWDHYGKRAGPIRNKHMLDTFQPDWVIAFAGGTGTANMVSLARNAGVRVTKVTTGWSKTWNPQPQSSSSAETSAPTTDLSP